MLSKCTFFKWSRFFLKKQQKTEHPTFTPLDVPCTVAVNHSRRYLNTLWGSLFIWLNHLDLSTSSMCLWVVQPLVCGPGVHQRLRSWDRVLWLISHIFTEQLFFSAFSFCVFFGGDFLIWELFFFSKISDWLLLLWQFIKFWKLHRRRCHPEWRAVTLYLKN